LPVKRSNAFTVKTPEEFSFEECLTFLERSPDEDMKNLIDRYYGLRVMGIPDLFEAIFWAIIGQHINLRFAYTLKKRFVKKYEKNFAYNGTDYYTFPPTETVAALEIKDLMKLQFGKKKQSILQIYQRWS